MKIYDISADLLKSPVYPGDPAPELRIISRIEHGTGCHLTALSACSHAGTHVDAPAHYIDGGRTIGDLPLDTFIGPCRVVAVFEPVLTGEHIDEMRLSGVERLLIKGFGKTVLSRSAAYALAAEGIRLVGIDRQSIGIAGDEAEVHKLLLSSGMVILEGLHLASVQSGDYTLFAPPVLVGDAEGAFCRAVLLDE